MKYNLILADPPWEYKDKNKNGKRGAGFKYKTMSLFELCLLPVWEIAADDCLLAMWWTGPLGGDAVALVDAWCFELKNMTGFTWHKTTVNGKDHFGTGHWTRGNAENCLFATRGKPKRVAKNVSQIITAQIGGHSEKPAEVRNRLVQLMGDVPRVELFATERVEGWDSWGNKLTELGFREYFREPRTGLIWGG